jgi:hypothetical protein
MKDCTRKHLLLMIAPGLIVIGSKFISLPVLSANNAKNQDKHTIRVTTGIQQVQGWEQGLVRSNPNLARWHWDPIYSYRQGYATVSPEAMKTSNGRSLNRVSGSPGKPAYNYIVPAPQDSRPKHIPISPQAMEEVQARYSQEKPKLPTAQPVQENVLGQLNHKDTQATLVAPSVSATVATYGKPYARRERFDTALKYSSQKATVYGQLMNAKSKSGYYSAKTSK